MPTLALILEVKALQPDIKPLKLYKSSAGSGKTFTLVKEYLRICLPQPERFSRIVAITFTNAAAAEMKERILERLKGLSEGREPDLAKLLLEEGILPAELENAPRLLEAILYNYTRFNVSTIDSFFHKILRAFSKELNLPMDFDIFLDTDEALEYAVDQFLHRSYFYPEYHRLLVEYIREKINSGNSWGVRSDLQRIAQELVKDNSFLEQDIQLEDIHDFISSLRKLIAAFEDKMHGLGRNALARMEEVGLSVEHFKYGRSGPAGHFVNILKENRRYVPGVRFSKGASELGEWMKKKDPMERLIEEAADLHLKPLAQEVLSVYEDEFPTYNTAKEIVRSIYTFAVYEEINKNLQEYRTKNDVVLVSDFTRILARHILKEQVSFIYSKVGARYEHFLIDEFQDTSTLQWLSLRPLVENAVAQGSACLVVGDSKQAIYRWRGGEVELIEHQISEQDFPQHSCQLSLTRNFRSGSVIVQFNNSFFRSISSLFDAGIDEYRLLEQIFSDVVQEAAARAHTGGYVQLNLLHKEGRSRENFLSKARTGMLMAIREAQASGYGLKDITILVRDKKDATDVARTLFNEKIEFITQDSLYLDHSPTIRLLFSLLYYLNDPRDELARTQVLFLYLRYFRPQEVPQQVSFTDIFLDFHKQEQGLFGYALPEEFVRRVFDLSALPVYELVEDLVRIFELNHEADAYIQRFQDVILEYTLAKNQGIKGFLNWYKSGKYTVVLPEDQEAIQIMTVHKSKGLEFPVVIIPFADWDFRSSKPDIMWVSSQQEPFDHFEQLPVLGSSRLKETLFAADFEREEALTAIDNLNLLYVALTRAKERLYVFTEKSQKGQEGFKDIAQLISQVLLTEISGEVEDDIVISYGEKTAISRSQPVAAHAFIEMREYPVFDWRNSIIGGSWTNVPDPGDILLEQEEEDVIELVGETPQETLIRRMLLQLPQLKALAKQSAGMQPAPELLLPGIGHYKPLASIATEDVIYLVEKKSPDKKDIITKLTTYSHALEKLSSKQVTAYLADPETGSLTAV